MTELLVLSLGALGLFLVSIALSYGLAWVIQRARAQTVPPEGASLKIRSGDRIYRSRFIGVVDKGWAFQPPVEKGAPVPLRVGEALFVEAVSPKGALRFQTILASRLSEPFVMTMKPPEVVRVIERRSGTRFTPLGEAHLSLEGAKAALIDIGERGAKLWVNGTVRLGERVRLDTPWSHFPLMGHVLDVAPLWGREFRNEIRVIFEEPAPVDLLKKQFAPAG